MVVAIKERKEDIPLLVEHFISKSAEENNKSMKTISEEAIRMLMNYDWPGNVRELENAIERSVVICQEDEIQPQHFLTFYDFQMNQDVPDQWNGEIKNLRNLVNSAFSWSFSPFARNPSKIGSPILNRNSHPSFWSVC